jgi:hypothetical protein
VACIINPEYADPATFDQVFDIFSTQSLTSAHLIEYQFGQLGPQNKSTILVYDSQLLNNSYTDISRSIEMGFPVSSGYLLAVLQAYNATGDSGGSSGPSGNSDGTGPTKSKSTNTALAMSVLLILALYGTYTILGLSFTLLLAVYPRCSVLLSFLELSGPFVIPNVMGLVLASAVPPKVVPEV